MSWRNKNGQIKKTHAICVLKYKDTDSPVQKETLNLDKIKNKSWFILAHVEIWGWNKPLFFNYGNSFSLIRLPDSLKAGNFAQFNPALHDNQFDTHLPTPKSFSSSIFFMSTQCYLIFSAHARISHRHYDVRIIKRRFFNKNKDSFQSFHTLRTWFSSLHRPVSVRRSVTAY